MCGCGSTLRPCKTAHFLMRAWIWRTPMRLPVADRNSGVVSWPVHWPRVSNQREGIDGVGSDRHDARLSALPEDAHFTGLEIDSIAVQASHFGNAQAARIDQFENGAVADRVRLVALKTDQPNRLLRG